MDASSVMAAYNDLKFAKDSLTTLLQGKIEIESQAKVMAALDKLGGAQDALFQMRDELFTLGDVDTLRSASTLSTLH